MRCPGAAGQWQGSSPSALLRKLAQRFRTWYEEVYWYTVRMSRAKTQLTRESIAAAALAIADAEGFQAVSMRRVAQELRVGTMSLYYYVRTKDDLISVMDDALMSEALLPRMPKNWKQAITEIATRTH